MQLWEQTRQEAFRLVSAALIALLVALWLFVAVRTLHGAWSGTLLAPSCMQRQQQAVEELSVPGCGRAKGSSSSAAEGSRGLQAVEELSVPVRGGAKGSGSSAAEGSSRDSSSTGEALLVGGLGEGGGLQASFTHSRNRADSGVAGQLELVVGWGEEGSSGGHRAGGHQGGEAAGASGGLGGGQ